MIYSRTVRLADTDAAGVVYFAHVLSMCHEAYEAALETAGIDLRGFFRDANVVIPIVHGEVDFLRPMFCGDKLAIEIIPQLLSETAFEITYQVLANSSSGECLAKAKTRHVCIHPTTRRRVAVPEGILQWLKLN